MDESDFGLNGDADDDDAAVAANADADDNEHDAGDGDAADGDNDCQDVPPPWSEDENKFGLNDDADEKDDDDYADGDGYADAESFADGDDDWQPGAGQGCSSVRCGHTDS